MKKIFPILMLSLAGFASYSCNDNDDDILVQNQADVPKVRDVTASFNSGNSFQFTQGINILNTDVVLVYRNINSNGFGNAVWQMIPKTFFIQDSANFPTGRELDYNFDFTASDVLIRTESNFNQTTELTANETSRYLTNQTFRIVLVPANANKTSAPVDHSDYNAVIKYYQLDDRNVKNTVIK